MNDYSHHPENRRCAAARFGILCSNRTIPTHTSRIYCGSCENKSEAELRRLRAPKPDNATFTELAGSDFMTTRAAVASDPRAPEHILTRLANDPEPGVRSTVAMNPSLTDEAVIGCLADDASPVVGAALAKREFIPEATLRQVIWHGKYAVVLQLLTHSSMTDNLALEIIDKKPPAASLASLAENPQLTVPVLKRLAAEPGEHVQAVVACHPNTTPEMLAEMSESDSYRVHHSIAQNPKATSGMLSKVLTAGNGNMVLSHLHARRLADHENTPDSVLQKILQGPWDRNSSIRLSETVLWHVNSSAETRHIAFRQTDNPSRVEALRTLTTLSAETVDWASRHRDTEVRSTAALHQGMAPQRLSQMTRFKDEETLQAVAANPNTPPEALLRLAASEMTQVRMYALLNPGVPQQALSLLSADADADMRMRVARHWNTSSADLVMLMADADEVVREYATESYKARQSGIQSHDRLLLAHPHRGTHREPF